MLSDWGLGLNIVGVVIVFFYGFPQPSLEEGITRGISGPEVDEHNIRIRKLKKRYLCISRIALGLIILGFVFQLWAIFL